MELLCTVGWSGGLATNFTLYVGEILPVQPYDQKDDKAERQMYFQATSQGHNETSVIFFIKGLKYGSKYLMSVYARNKFGRSTSLNYRYELKTEEALVQGSVIEENGNPIRIYLSLLSMFMVLLLALASIASIVAIIVFFRRKMKSPPAVSSNTSKYSKRSYARENPSRILQPSHSYFHFRNGECLCMVTNAWKISTLENKSWWKMLDIK